MRHDHFLSFVLESAKNEELFAFLCTFTLTWIADWDTYSQDLFFADIFRLLQEAGGFELENDHSFSFFALHNAASESYEANMKTLVK